MLEQIISVVRQAGDIVLSAQNVAGRTHTRTSAADLVTEYDVAVENFLREKLLALLPEAVFFGEEEEGPAHPERGWAFIVDPIDGTANFVRGLRQSAISVALARDGAVCTLEGEPLPIVERCGIWASNGVNRDVLKELEV